MTIKLEKTPIGWTAIESDTYDGPGSPIGSGPTELAAIKDLIEQERDARCGRG